MALDISRRTALRGMFNGAAVAVGLPLLDMFLNTNGTALAATGAPLPTRFGGWSWALGCNPDRFYPSKIGADYDIKPELEPIKALKHKINILSGFPIPLDGKPAFPHGTGAVAIRCGVVPTAAGTLSAPSFDVAIGDVIGTRTRFRSLDLAASGGPRNSLSGRNGGNINPSEGSVLGLYTRIFGPGFKDPNSATFTPDARVMARRSVLSHVEDERKAFEAELGSADKQRLDQYFTSLRQIEKQLDIELTKPDPLPACVLPAKAGDGAANSEIENVVKTHKIMTDLLVMALACDQSRVFNMNFSISTPSLTRIGSTVNHHQLTHEEAVDVALGYQPQATYFVNQSMQSWAYFVSALDAMKEGDGTLLDHSIVFAHSEVDFAKAHTVDNIPMMTAGSGNGRLKTGIHVRGDGTPATRFGYTLQQVMGAYTNSWGSGSLQTNKVISEIVA